MTLPQSPGPAPAYVAPIPTGAVSYGLGFLAFIPVPYLNFIVSGIVMAAVYPSQKRKGGIAAENARRAANWGLTLIVLLVLIVALTFALVAALSGNRDLAPIGISPLGLVLVLGAVHVVITIMGLVAATKGNVFGNRLAIPFFRNRPAV